MAFKSILIALHNVSYWKRARSPSFIDSSVFLPFFLSATAPLTSITSPPARWTAPCTFQTPAAGRCSKWNRWMLLKMRPRIWNWWPGPVTSVSPTMTPAAAMEAKPPRPFSPTPEVHTGFRTECRAMLIDTVCLKSPRDDGLAVEHELEGVKKISL